MVSSTIFNLYIENALKKSKGEICNGEIKISFVLVEMLSFADDNGSSKECEMKFNKNKIKTLMCVKEALNYSIITFENEKLKTVHY